MARTLVIGDVHGCSRELALLVGLSQADRVVLVGDLFTKGPDPEGVWEQVRRGGYDAVLGNHDQRLLALRRGDRHAREVCERLDAFDPSWRRWLEERPLTLEVGPFTVVHAAVHPLGEELTRDQTLTLRTWPDREPGAPHWHDLYEGSARILFGHDALSDLVVIGAPPKVVGLDGGCVYGGRLCGFLVEEEALYAVPAEQAYLVP